MRHGAACGPGAPRARAPHVTLPGSRCLAGGGGGAGGPRCLPAWQDACTAGHWSRACFPVPARYNSNDQVTRQPASQPSTASPCPPLRSWRILWRRCWQTGRGWRRRAAWRRPRRAAGRSTTTPRPWCSTCRRRWPAARRRRRRQRKRLAGSRRRSRWQPEGGMGASLKRFC